MILTSNSSGQIVLPIIFLWPNHPRPNHPRPNCPLAKLSVHRIDTGEAVKAHVNHKCSDSGPVQTV